MLAASLIDADEKIIPDEITISGTLVGAAACRRLARVALALCNADGPPTAPRFSAFNRAKRLASRPGRLSLDGIAYAWPGLLVALVRGPAAADVVSAARLARAIGLCWARVVRHRGTYRILRMGVAGSVAIVIVWFRGSSGWQGLLSALVGMAAGGGLIWLVRVIAAAVLRREAMGFGDVTLMAMIGAFLGWQPCMMIFFLAPLAGVVVGVFRLVFCRDKEIPYGPFLCLATAFVWSFGTPCGHGPGRSLPSAGSCRRRCFAASGSWA